MPQIAKHAQNIGCKVQKIQEEQNPLICSTLWNSLKDGEEKIYWSFLMLWSMCHTCDKKPSFAKCSAPQWRSSPPVNGRNCIVANLQGFRLKLVLWFHGLATRRKQLAWLSVMRLAISLEQKRNKLVELSLGQKRTEHVVLLLGQTRIELADIRKQNTETSRDKA